MPEIKPEDHLDWLSGRTAQDHAVRLCLACSSVLPTDQALQSLVDEQILGDLIGLAFHGRRLMERRNQKAASIGSDPLWPSSKVASPSGFNLWDSFGALIHAVEVKVQWEAVDLQPNPYKGREARFPGSVLVRSDQKEVQLPIGSIVAGFFGNVLNHQKTLKS